LASCREVGVRALVRGRCELDPDADLRQLVLDGVPESLHRGIRRRIQREPKLAGIELSGAIVQEALGVLRVEPGIPGIPLVARRSRREGLRGDACPRAGALPE